MGQRWAGPAAWREVKIAHKPLVGPHQPTGAGGAHFIEPPAARKYKRKMQITLMIWRCHDTNRLLRWPPAPANYRPSTFSNFLVQRPMNGAAIEAQQPTNARDNCTALPAGSSILVAFLATHERCARDAKKYSAFFLPPRKRAEAANRTIGGSQNLSAIHQRDK